MVKEIPRTVEIVNIRESPGMRLPTSWPVKSKESKAIWAVCDLPQADGHGECKFVHSPMAVPALLLDKIGGYTQQVRNPDSWEGWYWGAKHVWGKGWWG